MQTEWFKSKGVFLLAVVLVLAAALRIYNLGAESFWIDEVIMVQITQAGFDTVISEFVNDGRPPLYVFLSYAWSNLMGTSEVAVRYLSALLGVMTVAVMYIIGREHFGQKVALISAVLLTVSVFHIRYSQEHRYYSLVLFFTLTAAWFFTLSLGTRRITHVALFSLFSILMVYSHLFSVFILAGWGGYVIILAALRWKQYRSLLPLWVVSQIVVLIGIMPYLIKSFNKEISVEPGEVGLPHLLRPSINRPLTIPLDFLTEHYTASAFNGIFIILTIFVVGMLIYIWRKGVSAWMSAISSVLEEISTFWSNRYNSLLLAFLWFAVPVVGIFVGSYTLSPMYEERYIIGASPGLYLLIAAGIYAFRQVIPSVLSLMMVVLFVFFALSTYYVEPTKDEWRNVADYIQTNEQSQDGMVVPKFGAFLWYYAGELNRCQVEPHFREQNFIDELIACGGETGRTWLVLQFKDEKDQRQMADRLISYSGSTIEIVKTQVYQGVTIFLLEFVE